MDKDRARCKSRPCAVSQPFLLIYASEYGWTGGVGGIEGWGEEISINLDMQTAQDC